jgi:putative tricarboxylic transport membrane protein
VSEPPAGPPPIASRPAARPWALGAALVVFGLVWVHGALSLPQATTYAVVGPGLFPAVIGAGLILLGVLLLVAIARGERFEPQEAEDTDPNREPSRAALWLTAAAGLVPAVVARPLGFPVAAALAFALTARAFGSRRLARDLGLGLGLGIACWLLFSRLLGLALPGFPPLGIR